MLGDGLNLEAPLEFPEGRYSGKDKIEVLAESEEAMKVVRTAIKLATNFDLAPGVGMWDMMKAMSLEGMAGNMMPAGFLQSLNAKLIKIDKK